MSFIISVQEVVQINGSPATAVERYRQEVDALDLSRIIAAVNTKPRQRRSPNKPKAAQP